jgi:hypothetical protein
MIVDEIKVLTGSYNWTKSAAEYNQENIIITDNDEIVTGFIENFSQLWETSVFINNVPSVRMGDIASCGDPIINGSPNVFFG